MTTATHPRPGAPIGAFEVRLEPLLETLRDMWVRRWAGVSVAWVAALLAAVTVSGIPDRYETKARVYVDTQTIIKPLLQGLTVQPDIDQMVAMLARTLITRPNIERLIGNPDIGATLASNDEREKFIEYLTREIKVNLSSGRNLYEISYRDVNPERSRRVVTELVALFVSSGTSDKRRDTDEARKFIDEQLAIYEKKLADAEQRLKEFKLRNINVTGGLGGPAGQDYFARMAALQQDLATVRIDLNAAEQSRDALQRQLSGEQTAQAAAGAPGRPAITELDARIDAQRKQLDELRRRFTDEHPDVLAARRLIEQLDEERRQELQRGRQHPAESSIDQKDNLALQQMKVKLAEADATVASLHGKAAALTARLQELREAASQVPQAEAELAQLNRDYDVIKKNYEQLVQRRESASISGDADADAHMADFRVIDPPRLAPKPVFPSHSAMVPLALLFSLGLGLATCFGLSRLIPTVHSARRLRTLADRPVLGSISIVPDAAMRSGQRRSNMALVASVGILVLAYATWTVVTLR